MIILRLKQRFKSAHHSLYTEEVNKIALDSNDDQRLQTFDKIASFPHRTNAFKVCEDKMIVVRDLFVENYSHFLFFLSRNHVLGFQKMLD